MYELHPSWLYSLRQCLCGFRITGFGERVLGAELARLEKVVRTAQQKGLFPPSGRGVSFPGEA